MNAHHICSEGFCTACGSRVFNEPCPYVDLAEREKINVEHDKINVEHGKINVELKKDATENRRIANLGILCKSYAWLKFLA